MGVKLPVFRVLFESSPGWYLVLDPAFSIVAVSDAYLPAAMTRGQDIVGKKLFEAFPDNPAGPKAAGVWNLRGSLNRMLGHEALDTMAIQKHDIRRPTSEGGGSEGRFWSPVTCPVLSPAGEFAFIIRHVEDVPDSFDQMAETLRQTEAAPRQAVGRLKESRQRLQVLSRRLMEVQETERRHLARELHDEIGQALTVAELNLQAMLQSPGADALLPRLKESLQVVERVQEQVHDLALNLRPSMLDDLGLEAALRWYTGRQATLAGLLAEVRVDPLEQRLDPRIETECYRVAQGALTNVVKYAKAHTVTVELSKNHDDAQLHLSVRDDGVGFDVASVRAQAVRGASLGLLSMEERTILAGGAFECDSTPGRGTEVRAWFPLKWARPTVSNVAI
jgi:signal transduction histidine kinase